MAAAAYLRFTHSLRRPSLNLALAGGYARFSTLLLRELTAAGLGLTAPLFTGGGIEGQIEEAAAQLAELSSQEEALHQKISLNVSTALLHYHTASLALAVVDSKTTAMQVNYRSVSERHRDDIASGVELDNAQAELTSALVQNKAGQFAVQLATVDLRFAIGHM